MNRTVSLSIVLLLALSACAPEKNSTLSAEASKAANVAAAQAYARTCLTAVDIQKVERNAPDYSFVPAQANCADAFLGESAPQIHPDITGSLILPTAD